ncbi:metallo-beta-lactamase superfamily protein [Nitzschia inconspicua]|uniref:Metallo-beta-lactamase superfamily protein n=1 Tax=Nitzschia inconspicua TaxID=303405 RepID=A0A9K3LFJ5_9STRA|nr:metallo-beta-lactamase superfamily protein [Nitzschia inconspicua]
MKRFFSRKRRSQSANDGLADTKSKEQQAIDTAHSAPSLSSNKDSFGVAPPAGLNTPGSKGDSPTKKEKTSGSQLPTLSRRGRNNLPAEELQSDHTPSKTPTKTSRITSNSMKNSTEPAMTRNMTKNTDEKEQMMQYADTDSDDAGLLPSEIMDEYKGVSRSFRGLDAIEQFDDQKGSVDPDGRLAGISDAYDSIPLIEQTKLPRGGISMETKAVGRIQFGIPPETIKDSMRLGIPVPQVYIVPAERFCREMGPALGVNLAEFEFPAYFNFFVYKKQCTLVVDSQDAEDNICRVFEETLLGPQQFRRKINPIQFEEEDFADDFPRDAIPNFEKELGFFRILGDGSELTLDKLLAFRQFRQPREGLSHDSLGVPPNVDAASIEEVNELVQHDYQEALEELHFSEAEAATKGDLPTGEEANGKDSDTPEWSYGRARWFGEVATVWPTTATQEQIANRAVPRVEIFKMPSGTEYIIHDVNEHNVIIGKARFSGHVKVSESMSVEGFGGQSILSNNKKSVNAKVDESFDLTDSPMIPRAPPSFHPPSFGVTILGNSHGFDASGSVSGYVLWINGRGVMIDPPPYSSATLEREGIRPRTIVGIVLTHTHADHDAGAFQKVLTGSPVVVITTPTIYKSFIRKYAALASLSPALLQHSHRYKPAIIGQPLRFQGATFHFFYSLHAIPCVGFRVEWRGRSMVFTGDHMNKPDDIDKLQTDGVLSKARADDLRNMPLQETDLLLHEAGAPPIHTPLEVLQKLPQRVKKRMYVVHTSNIPKEFDLKVAPTGTAGTLRLDQLHKGAAHSAIARVGVSTWIDRSVKKGHNPGDDYSRNVEDEEILSSAWGSASNEYNSFMETDSRIEGREKGRRTVENSFIAKSQQTKPMNRSSIVVGGKESAIPLVSLRPASSTDAWFILNLLSAVPFLSSLSYSSTMEVLETARVDAYCCNDIVVPSSRRRQLLCVVWEGTCVERDNRKTKFNLVDNAPNLALIEEDSPGKPLGDMAVWHAGDWTGPIALQPDKRLSGESDQAEKTDIVAMSAEGVKVITVEFAALHNILMSSSQLYRKYVERQKQQQRRLSYAEGVLESSLCATTQKLLSDSLQKMNVLDLIDQNSALRKLSAVQKRHLESLAEGPIAFNPGERLWRSGAPVDSAYLVVAGTVSFVPRRRNAGSATLPSKASLSSNNCSDALGQMGTSTKTFGDVAGMQQDLMKAVEEMGEAVNKSSDDIAEASEEEGQILLDNLFSRSTDGMGRSTTEAHDFAKLSMTLRKRAELLTKQRGPSSDASMGSSHDDFSHDSSSHFSLDDDGGGDGKDHWGSLTRRRSSRARFANKMVEGLYAATDASADQSFPVYGFGDKSDDEEKAAEHITNLVIHEVDDGNHVVHSSTLTAGKDGCVVLLFPKSTLIPFLDEYPGLLLSLLGTQVVV